MNDIKKAVQQMYDEASEYFSKTREKSYGESENWPVIQQYLDELGEGERVLDVGCGSGRLVSGLPNKVKYVGIDFSNKLLEIAREIYPEREFRYGDITEKEAWENLGEFSSVYSIATVHHVPTREERLEVIRKMYEVTKPGGKLYLTVWNLWNQRLWQNKLSGVDLEAGKVVEMTFNKQAGRHVVAMEVGCLVKLMHEAGWKVEEAYYANREGEKCEIREGENLVVVGRK
jgi:SAM-dependent methyltransferase